MISILFAALLSLNSFALYEERFISAPGTFPANHGSTILEIESGLYLTCWYAGAREGATDVQIYCSKWKNGSTSWSAPKVAVKRQERVAWTLLKNKTLGNPVLTKAPNGRLWLFYAARPFGGWVMTHVDYKFSDDNGETWSEGKRLIFDFGHLTRSKVMWVGENKLLLPVYTELPYQAYTAQVLVEGDYLAITQSDYVPGRHALQPSLVVLNDQLHAFMRNAGTGVVLMSKWNSRLEIWSQMTKLALPNPNSAVDVVARSNNEMLIVYNSHAGNRSPLTLAISKDGVNFRPFHDLEPYGENKEYSYPAMIKVGDRYHVTYTYDHRKGIKHVTFDEAWLTEKLR